MITNFRSGAKYIRGPKHRLEIHWEQNESEPLSLTSLKLYSYRIPMTGPFKLIKALLNRNGNFIGEMPLKIGVDPIITWLEQNNVAKNLRDQFSFSINYLNKWKDIDPALLTLGVVEKIAETTAEVLIYCFGEKIKLTEEELAIFQKEVEAHKPGAEIEIYSSTIQCTIPPNHN